MSSIVKGDPLIKRNETEKSSKSDKKSKKSDNLPKRNQKKSKNKQKSENSEPQIPQLDSENGPSSSKEIEITTLAPSGSKKISKTVDKESSGYGIIWGSPYLYFDQLSYMYG